MLKSLLIKYPLINLDITVIDRQNTLDKIQLVGEELKTPVYLRSLLQANFQLVINSNITLITPDRSS
jgi:hypothetical protein